jgi:hypothetical protein
MKYKVLVNRDKTPALYQALTNLIEHVRKDYGPITVPDLKHRIYTEYNISFLEYDDNSMDHPVIFLNEEHCTMTVLKWS